MAEKALSNEQLAHFEALKKAYQEKGITYNFTEAQPFTFGELDLSGITDADRDDVLYMLGVVTNFIQLPIQYDGFADQNERSDWRKSLPDDARSFAEKNKIRANKIGTLRKSIDLLEFCLGENPRYTKAKEIITKLMQAIDEVMNQEHDPKNPEAAPVQPYMLYTNEQKVAFVQKLDEAARLLIRELEKRE